MSPRRLNLTDSQIIEMRESYAADPLLTHAALADEYGVGRGTTTRIIQGKYRPDLGGPFTRGRFHKAPVTPGDCDILYSMRAAGAYLGIRRSTVREYLRRGDLLQELSGLVSLDSMIRYQSRQYVPPPMFPPLTFTCCTRCGLLEFDDDGLCRLCLAELRGGGYVLYHRALWI